jgi:3-isopropylmalate/(R)-2-methylmalate dehydratase small subunit
LPEDKVRELARALTAANAPELDVDIATRTITGSGGTIAFALDEARRIALLEGLDEVDLMLRDASLIDNVQARLRREQPWLFTAAATLRGQA